MDLQPSTHQRELMDLAFRLATERFAARAFDYDRDTTFPFEDYADLRTSGLLALCVPEQYGGLGAEFETYCLVVSGPTSRLTVWWPSRSHGAMPPPRSPSTCTA